MPFLIMFLFSGITVEFAKLQYCVYVLISEIDHNFYVGYTTDLKQRLTAHYNGQVDSTASRRPLRLIHCEYYLAKDDALRRETYLKTTKGRRTLKLMLLDSLKCL
jgi:putative endonuclease